MVARTTEQRQDLLKKAQERLASLKSNSAKATNHQLETAMKSVDYFKRITAPKSAPKPRKPTNVPKDKIFCRRFENGKVWCKDRDKAGSQPLRSNPKHDAKVKALGKKPVASAPKPKASTSAGASTSKSAPKPKPAPKAKPAPKGEGFLNDLAEEVAELINKINNKAKHTPAQKAGYKRMLERAQKAKDDYIKKNPTMPKSARLTNALRALNDTIGMI